jgi:hypothetical protein
VSRYTKEEKAIDAAQRRADTEGVDYLVLEWNGQYMIRKPKKAAGLMAAHPRCKVVREVQCQSLLGEAS